MNVIQSSRLNTVHNQDDCDTIEAEILVLSKVETDQLVLVHRSGSVGGYELYGLTDEEIQIVEESVNA